VKNRFQKNWRGIVTITVAAILLFSSLWLFNIYIRRIAVPHSEKLADCTNGVTNFRLKVPNGHAYNIFLSLPGIQAKPDGTVVSTYEFSGQMRILKGTSLIADFAIGREQAWLTASGFVLTGVGLQNTNAPPLSLFIKPQETYDVEIILHPAPPPLSSIWLYYLENARDRNQ
jgi:hypothetical protein